MLGNGAVFIDWTKANDFSDFDLVTPLLAWGYPRDCARWFALLDQLEAENLRVSNPVSILRWNSDKTYLAELDAVGIPSVAEQALAATAEITKSGPMAYARVDILRDGNGVFRLMELELIEPSLFLRFAPDAGTAFAQALVSSA